MAPDDELGERRGGIFDSGRTLSHVVQQGDDLTRHETS